MSQPFLGELRMFGFNFPPKGWAFANGQILAISQNQALFALLGTTYGGNGIQTFALPNLQGRTALHRGNSFTQGSTAGETAVTLNLTQIPAHTHPLFANPGLATTSDPANSAPAKASTNIYGPPGSITFDPTATTAVGGGQAHNNMPPYLVISWCIALAGVFPSRN